MGSVSKLRSELNLKLNSKTTVCSTTLTTFLGLVKHVKMHLTTIKQHITQTNFLPSTPGLFSSSPEWYSSRLSDQSGQGACLEVHVLRGSPACAQSVHLSQTRPLTQPPKHLKSAKQDNKKSALWRGLYIPIIIITNNLLNTRTFPDCKTLITVIVTKIVNNIRGYFELASCSCVEFSFNNLILFFIMSLDR